jgi:hypothetical protein
MMTDEDLISRENRPQTPYSLEEKYQTSIATNTISLKSSLPTD